MLIIHDQTTKFAQHNVLLADICDVTGEQVRPIRSFSTSEQLIRWVKQHPGIVYKIVAREVGGPGFGLRRRLDGGYTVGDWSQNTASIVPDSVRFFRDFLPLWRLHHASTTLRLTRSWARESLVPRTWKPDHKPRSRHCASSTPRPRPASWRARGNG